LEKSLVIKHHNCYLRNSYDTNLVLKNLKLLEKVLFS